MCITDSGGSLVGGFSVNKNDQNSSRLLIIAYDGLRPDFITEAHMPTLWRLSQEGVWASNGMLSQYPTITAPNFLSISTGLYIEEHGIIDNTWKDPFFNETYDYFNASSVVSAESRWYTSGEPIWVVNEEAGGISALMKWPFCDVKGWSAKFCDKWTDYLHDTKSRADIFDQLFRDWMGRQNANLGLYYISFPDHTEHENSIDSEEVKAELTRIDQLTAYILESVNGSQFKDTLNIVFVSDHGHVDVDKEENWIDIRDYLSAEEIERVDGTWGLPQCLFKKAGVPEKDFEKVYAKLKAAQVQGANFSVYRPGDFPEGLHFAKGRVPSQAQIILEPDFKFKVFWDHFDERFEHAIPRYGSHGYRSTEPEMFAFFIGYGPAFKPKYQFESQFENIDLYPLFCHLLHIERCPLNNGSWDRIAHVLAVQEQGVLLVIFNFFNTNRDFAIVVLTLTVAGLVLGCFVGYTIKVNCCKGPTKMRARRLQALELGAKVPNRTRRPLLASTEDSEAEL